MKIKLFTLVLLASILFISKPSSAQVYTETSTFGNTYIPLSDPTLIANTWNDSLFLQGNIHTTFNWFGQTWPFDGAGNDGILLFGAGTLAGGSSTDSIDFDFDGFFTSLKSKSNSAMDFEIDGSTPNRIIKFDWKNAGLTYGDTSDYVNFQMWLYENATYEVHFGKSSVKDPNVAFGKGLSGPPIGLFIASTKKADNNKILKAFYLTGNPSNPTLNPSLDYNGLTGMPANGTTYTFNCTVNAGIKDEIAILPEMSIYPNPTAGFTTVSYNTPETSSLSIQILDITGKCINSVYNGLTAKGVQKLELNLSEYPKGLYFVKIQSGTSIETRKLIIE